MSDPLQVEIRASLPRVLDILAAPEGWPRGGGPWSAPMSAVPPVTQNAASGLILELRGVPSSGAVSTFTLQRVAFGTLLRLNVTGDVPDDVETREWLSRLRHVCESHAATAPTEPLDGGDPACWLHLPLDQGQC